MTYTLEEFRHKVLDKAEEVYQIFVDFFGEEYVDLQYDDLPLRIEFILPDNVDNGVEEIDLSNIDIMNIKDRLNSRLSIVVWWPEVTVTNEHDRSVVIWDLYAKIKVTTSGTIPYEYTGFNLKRSTYNDIQLGSGYMHSHISSVYADRDSLARWMNPCLGRGPIKGTILELKNSFDDIKWMLFCQELSMYVTVESLSGVPYKYLENIGNFSKAIGYQSYRPGAYAISDLPKPYGFTNAENVEWLNGFIQYYLQHNNLKIGYSNREFSIGIPYFDFIVDISNACIEYLNTTSDADHVRWLFKGGVLQKLYVIDKAFCMAGIGSTNVSALEGAPILYFKDSQRNLHIRQESVEHEQATVLNYKVAQYILDNILKVINYRYRNEHTNSEERGHQTSAPTYQRVIYLQTNSAS